MICHYQSLSMILLCIRIALKDPNYDSGCGGIRWSDRQEDYRTEVLSLMKAQQVKNSVIVPSGAKGVLCQSVYLQILVEITNDEAIKC